MKKVNIVYDFDGTLTKTALPKYLILEKCGYKNGTANSKFLSDLENIKRQNNCESMEAFYEVFFDILKKNNMKITESDFYYGIDKIEYNIGIENYFDNVNSFCEENSIEINHFILTSGVKGFVENCMYSKYFKEVFGCTFNIENGYIKGIDYYLSTKEKINKLKILQEKNETRADKTIYVGDGLTDYYAMKYIHNMGENNTIFVHQNENDLDIYNELNKEKIVDYCEIANYSENSQLFQSICKAIVDD